MDEDDIDLEIEIPVDGMKKVQRVEFKDVKQTGFEIALRFKSKKLPLEEVEKVGRGSSEI